MIDRRIAMQKSRMLIFFVVLFITFSGLKTAEAKTEGTVDSYYLENDAPYHQDRHYTNGFKYTTLHEPQDISQEWLARKINSILPLVDIEPESGWDKRFGKVFGQNIYTPQHIEDPQSIPDDRPYAGYLYGGYVLASYNDVIMKRMEVDIGMVGPYSFAEQTQKLVHRAGGWTIPQGWDHQIQSELGIMLTYEDRYKIKGRTLFSVIDYDMIPRARWSLGNVMTDAAVGNMVRIGYNLPNDFGNGHIIPAAKAFKPAPPINGNREPQSVLPKNEKPNWGIYIFGDAEGRWVVRNIFLDGNTFRSSQRVDKEPFVADLEIGVAIVMNEVEIAYRQVTRSKEFKEQVGDNKFASLSVIVRY
jgi:lipid A 3-O-deacylase